MVSFLLQVIATTFKTDMRLRRGLYGSVRSELAGLLPRQVIVPEAAVITEVTKVFQWYPSCSPCLVRSIVLATYLRRFAGLNAHVVVGITASRCLPARRSVNDVPRGHAWVQIGERIIANGVADPSDYVPLDRF
jgi:hypothetical protein